MVGQGTVKRVHFWVFSTSHLIFRKVTNRGIQLTCYDPKMLRHEQGDPTDLLWSKNVYVTNRAIQLTCFDPKTLGNKQGDPTDLLWSKNVTLRTRNWPYIRCSGQISHPKVCEWQILDYFNEIRNMRSAHTEKCDFYNVWGINFNKACWWNVEGEPHYQFLQCQNPPLSIVNPIRFVLLMMMMCWI